MEVCRQKSKLGEPGTVALVSIGGTSMTESDAEIVKETAEIHDLPKIVPVATMGMEALQGRLRTICSSAWAAGPLYTLVVPLQRDRY